MTGARALMEMLEAEGVEYVFGNPGTSESAIIDALEEHPNLQYILATQEGVAMGMADAYARSSGKTAFVNLHIDCGLANGISLLTNAFEAGTPMVLTSANKDVRKLAEGRADLPAMTDQYTKWSVEVTHPEQVPSVIRRAFNEARTPPTGPVYVSFSGNALDDEAEMEIVPSGEGYFQTRPDRRAIEEAAAILVEASTPAILVGDRVANSDGASEAVRLAELTGAAVYATNFARVNFPTSHPQFLGMTNPGMPASKDTMSKYDAVIVVGASVFSGLFYFSGRALDPDTKLIHIDSDYEEVGKSEPTDVGIISSPKMAMADLADTLEARMSGTSTEAAKGRAVRIGEEKAQQKSAWEKRVRDRWDVSPMSTERMMSEISSALPNDAMIVDDSITTRASVFGAIDFDEQDSLVGIVGAALGWGMGGAMGAKLAHPERQVVAIVGDGSSMMTVQALWTAANANIPVVYLICNNQSYRVLKLNMDVYKTQVRKEENPTSKYMAMDFPERLNIAGIAEAIGVDGRIVEDPTELAPALKEALASGKPAVLDVYIDGSI